MENFTVAGTDITYPSETVTIDKLILNLKGDRWALIQNHRTALSDFDRFLRATKLTGNTSINRLTAPDQLFENMGAYGFNDLFGLLTLGPLGTVVTQGYDQLESLEKMMAAEGNNRIQQILIVILIKVFLCLADKKGIINLDTNSDDESVL